MRPQLVTPSFTKHTAVKLKRDEYRTGKIHFFLGVLIMISFSLISQQSHASPESPTTFVKTIFTTLTKEVNALTNTASTAQVEALFEEKLSPHIDYAGIARWVLREHWADSEAPQRDAFLTALQTHLVKTYAAALSFDKNTDLTLDEDVKSGKRLTQVSGTLTTTESNTTDILFRLVEGPSAWRIFDVGVRGISVARTLRADVAAIAKQGGIEAATAALTAGNFQLITQR